MMNLRGKSGCDRGMASELKASVIVRHQKCDLGDFTTAKDWRLSIDRPG